MKKIVLFICLITVLVSVEAMAAKPFNLSLTPDIAIYDRSQRIEGLCLSVWGENPQTAIALGIANGSTGDSAGFSWGWALNYADDYKGIQWAAINYNKDEFLGWQSGFVNYAGGRMMGFQSGIVNYSQRLKGLQLGFVNFTETADAGVQIGLVNFIPENRWFKDLPDGLAPGMIFINWRF